VFDIPHPHRRPGSLHDQVFKDLIGAFLPDFVTLVAPEAAGFLDLSRWGLLNKEIFTDWPRGRRRELDLLAEIPLADGTGSTALIHVEIEARHRPGIGQRLSAYSMQIRLRHGRPVVTFLLCLRRGTPGVSLQSVIDVGLGLEINHFRHYSFCLSGSSAEDLLARDQPLAWALAALARPGSLSRAELKLACLRRIEGASVDDLRRFLLANCVETYLELEGRDAEEMAALQAGGDAEENRVMRRRATWAEQLVDERWSEGVEQGGKQMLLRLLGVRFGPLSEDVKRRVEAIASAERLNQIAEQVLGAKSLEEMGLR
jgi:hypothetical protein